MLKVLLLSIGFIFASLPYVNTVTVDPNTANNDCFVRIYAEAMIPPERTFRTSDTNSIRVCQELCAAEGVRCQSFSFGVSPLGNGTCQLSGERISENAGRRPRGTLYDPDFNMYQRRTNCGMEDEFTRPTGGTLPTVLPTTFSSDSPPSTMITSTNTMSNSNTYPDRLPPPTQMPSDGSSGGPVTIDTTSSTRPYRPTIMMDDRPNTTLSDGHYTPTMTNVPDRPSTSGYGNTDIYTNEVRPQHPTTIFTSTPMYFGDTKPDYPYPPQYPDKYNYYQDIYPMYSFPMLYNGDGQHPGMNAYPMNGYAANVPSIGTPQSTVNYYGNLMPTTTTTAMNGGRPRPPQIPHGNEPMGSTPYMGNGWSNADEINRRKPNGDRTTPSMPQPNEYGGGGNGIGTTRYPEGNYNPNDTRPRTTIPFIRTYFNPDDYIASRTRKPGDSSFGSGNGYFTGHTRPPFEFNRPCFRRALAGKRVASQWVRRTLACERVEDCQTECSREKRFLCEGFNYRLDPTGHGQGICELIDVSLNEMDIYSSPDRRDETLLYHPDYDYYERDRNACRPSLCTDCTEIGGGGGGGKPYLPDPHHESGYNDRKGSNYHHEPPPPHFSGGKPYLPSPGSSNYGGERPTTYRPIDNFKPYYESRPPPSHESSYSSSPDLFRPPYANTAIDKYRPPPIYEPSHSYEHRPPPPSSFSNERPYEYDRYDTGPQYRPVRPSYDTDRYDVIKPLDRPSFTEISIYEERRPDDDYRPHRRPLPPPSSEYGAPPPPSGEYGAPPSSYSFGYRPKKPHRIPQPVHGDYLDREREIRPHQYYRKPTQPPFIPYMINKENNGWGSYGGHYGSPNNFNHPQDLWIQNNKPKNEDFNYFSLGHMPKYPPEDNSVLSYPGSKYDTHDKGYQHQQHDKDKSYYGSLWTRRPGPDECSVKSSEGFRLHKAVVRLVYHVPTVTECERMCHAESKFRCVTYSYRYSPLTRDNCLLCDRPLGHLDYYSDIEPDRDYDIYAMADDPQMCQAPVIIDPHSRQNANAQCFFRAIDGTRFFKSIVRDSLNVRSVGECEMECIKTNKFTCRAFSFRYGPKKPGSIIDNCQLSDWPVRDMDKDRHLINDDTFDVFERASYGHGCEIQPISDDKHKKLCYLGYGSPAKLLSSAIKKVVSVPTELDCKNECIRFRETTPFKCYSFSFGSQASTFNCEMSDLDQSQLKFNVDFAHSTDRDYWLFAWNPFDLTCRDKVATIGGANRVNNDRRMDVFREPDGESTWRHFTVSGKACRIGSACEKNLITGFYSCELDGGEVGSWDYCCKSDYPCGYSQGFSYPWCFVGDGIDQWRTCSDRYYPISSSSSHNNHVASSDTNSIKKKVSPISYTANKRKGDNYHQPAPRPGGLQNLEDVAAARLWPITYIYSSGPPNSTELSNVVDCNEESC